MLRLFPLEKQELPMQTASSVGSFVSLMLLSPLVIRDNSRRSGFPPSHALSAALSAVRRPARYGNGPVRSSIQH